MSTHAQDMFNYEIWDMTIIMFGTFELFHFVEFHLILCFNFHLKFKCSSHSKRILRM